MTPEACEDNRMVDLVSYYQGRKKEHRKRQPKRAGQHHRDPLRREASLLRKPPSNCSQSSSPFQGSMMDREGIP